MGDTLHTEHAYGFDVNNTRLIIMDKTYAACFRKFWAYFMKYDLNKTIEVIEKTGIRTSNSEYFVSKNGSKKKNIFVKEGYWIYTHLNPKAMERAYEKFLLEWEGKVVKIDTIRDESKEKPKLKNIYKKSLAMELCRKGHDIEHTMRNRENPKYQVFVFEDTPELIRDLLELTKKDEVAN